MLGFFIFACSSTDQADPHIVLARNYLEEFSDFETWEQDSSWEGVQPSQSAHGPAVQIWLNELAMTALRNGHAYPDGAAIFKEGYVDEEGTQRKALTIMVKKEDFAPDTEDWFWAVYSNTDDVEMAGTPEYCLSCHAASSDYVLFIENP